MDLPTEVLDLILRHRALDLEDLRATRLSCKRARRAVDRGVTAARITTTGGLPAGRRSSTTEGRRSALATLGACPWKLSVLQVNSADGCGGLTRRGLARLVATVSWDGLTVLDLCGQALDSGFETLAALELPRLESLSMLGCRLGYRAARGLAFRGRGAVTPWPRLKNLCLAHNHLRHYLGFVAAAALPALLRLDLASNGIADLSPLAAAATNWPELRSLRLDCNRLSQLELPPFPRLMCVYANYNNFDPALPHAASAELVAMDGCAHPPPLADARVLSLRRLPPASDLGAALALASDLRSLDLCGTRMWSAMAGGWRGLPPLPALRVLKMASCRLGDARGAPGIYQLAAAGVRGGLPQLRALDVSLNGPRVVAALERLDHARAWPRLDLVIADGAPQADIEALAAVLAGLRVDLRARWGDCPARCHRLSCLTSRL
jgi:hypothetical protein